MRQVTVDPSGYEALVEHLPRGRSLRQIARELGRSHETIRTQIAQDGDRLVDAVEGHMRRGRTPLFEVPYGPLQDLAVSLTLAQYAVDQLRARGWAVLARTVRYPGLDGIAFEIVYEEEESE